MNEQERILKEALAENAQFKAEKADVLRTQATADFRDKLGWVERVTWIYLLVCVVLGVPTLNLFMRSTDVKTLISCALGLSVIYGTTVLMKLWFASASTKLGVLKEIKQLRLEVSQLATAAGVASPTDVLSTKYEPIRGTSKLERKTWLVVLVLAGAIAGSVARGEYDGVVGGGSSKLAADSLVTLTADGNATSATKIDWDQSGSTPSSEFQFYAPASCTFRWVDSQGREMPHRTTPEDTHVRYDVSLPQDCDQTTYSQLAESPGAATQTDDVWTYASDMEYGHKLNDFTTTVLLPEGAELISVEPKPALEFTSNDRPAYRFQGTRGQNEKFEFQLKYRLKSESSE